MKRYQLNIHRSNKYLTAQIIDDNGKVLTSVSKNDIEKETNKTKQAKLAGEILAAKAKKAKVIDLYLNRKKYRYQGRVAAFCQSLREQKINI